MSKFNNKIKAIDFFCGAGGLTHGLLRAGVDVVAGYDIDPACEYAYAHNNTPSKFFRQDSLDVLPSEIEEHLKGAHDRERGAGHSRRSDRGTIFICDRG